MVIFALLSALFCALCLWNEEVVSEQRHIVGVAVIGQSQPAADPSSGHAVGVAMIEQSQPATDPSSGHVVGVAMIAVEETRSHWV